jgi:uncharacterized lipoprotein YbaY
MRTPFRSSIARATSVCIVIWSAVLAACGSSEAARARAAISSAPDIAFIEGVATYRERIALPPDAVFEAVLQEVSRADAPAVEISHTTEDRPAFPIRFTISFDERRIDPQREYVVRATVRVNESQRVLTSGANRNVEIPMRMVRGAARDTTTGTGSTPR